MSLSLFFKNFEITFLIGINFFLKITIYFTIQSSLWIMKIIIHNLVSDCTLHIHPISSRNFARSLVSFQTTLILDNARISWNYLVEQNYAHKKSHKHFLDERTLDGNIVIRRAKRFYSLGLGKDWVKINIFKISNLNCESVTIFVKSQLF